VIGYDLDGVLVPDFEHIDSITTSNEFYNLLLAVKPLFVPRGDYVIITARDAEHKSATQTWARRHLTNRPQDIYQSRLTGETPAEYKCRMLNSRPHIAYYIESSADIVAEMRPNTKYAQVMVWSEYINQQLRTLK
jgi:hypothetical protein